MPGLLTFVELAFLKVVTVSQSVLFDVVKLNDFVLFYKFIHMFRLDRWVLK